jgi:hypothetical protein
LQVEKAVQEAEMLIEAVIQTKLRESVTRPAGGFAITDLKLTPHTFNRAYLAASFFDAPSWLLLLGCVSHLN